MSLLKDLSPLLYDYESNSCVGSLTAGKPLPLVTQIQKLFRGREGALYINDPATMYQDAKGTTPVTAVDDPVGLWIDQSKGGEANLGPNIVINSDFGTGDLTGWIDDTSHWEVVGGRAYHASSSVFNMLRTDISDIPDGATIKVEFDLEYIASGDGRVRVQFRDASGGAVGGGSIASHLWSLTAGNSLGNPDSGRISGYFVKPTGAEYIAWARDRTNGDKAEFYIDNISVREIPGYHATQSTSAARPLLKQDEDGRYYLQFDGVDDYLVPSSLPTCGNTGNSISAGYAGSFGSGTIIGARSATSSVGTDYMLFKSGAEHIWGTGTSADSIAWLSVTESSDINVEIATVNDAAKTKHYYRNGGLVASGTYSIKAPAATRFSIGIEPYDKINLALDGELYGVLVIAQELSPTNMGVVSKYLAELSGVSL